jgi:hypothetical protein
MDETNYEHNITDIVAIALEAIVQLLKCRSAGRDEICRKLEGTLELEKGLRENTMR